MEYWLEVSEIDTKQKEAETKSSENSDSKKTHLKKIKIAVYFGKEAEKAQQDEIYHLNLSIYVPQDNTKHAASTQKEEME